MTRAKNLLICIGLVFLICWIPINSINLISDLMYMCDASLLNERFSGLEINGVTFFKWMFLGISALTTSTSPSQLVTFQPWFVQVGFTFLMLKDFLYLISVINPAIYGYFNENFRREFIILYKMVSDIQFWCQTIYERNILLKIPCLNFNGQIISPFIRSLIGKLSSSW